MRFEINLGKGEEKTTATGKCPGVHSDYETPLYILHNHLRLRNPTQNPAPGIPVGWYLYTLSEAKHTKQIFTMSSWHKYRLSIVISGRDRDGRRATMSSATSFVTLCGSITGAAVARLPPLSRSRMTDDTLALTTKAPPSDRGRVRRKKKKTRMSPSCAQNELEKSHLSPVDFSDLNLVLGAARRKGPAPGVGPLPVGLLLLNLYLDGVPAMEGKTGRSFLLSSRAERGH